MKIEAWSATNFRNIRETELHFGEGVNVLYGDNAQGKTNALEGISLFSHGRSFRGAKEKEMIFYDAPFTSLSLQAYKEGKGTQTFQNLSLIFSKSKRICKKNGVHLPRLSEWIGNIQTVVFCPEHLHLVKDGPSVRRNFLDLALIAHHGAYLERLRCYRHVLEQRNALLKQAKSNRSFYLSTIEEYNAQLSKYGVPLSVQRAQYLHNLQQKAKEILLDLSCGKERLEMHYRGLLTEQAYQKAFERHAEAELTRNVTLYGAHLDDFAIELNGKDARLFASQGQGRSIAFALKLAEGELLKEAFLEYPIFLLDDIFSELDSCRKEYIMKELKGRQVILSTCDSAVCHLWKDATVYTVANGSFSKKQ